MENQIKIEFAKCKKCSRPYKKGKNENGICPVCKMEEEE